MVSTLEPFNKLPSSPFHAVIIIFHLTEIKKV